MDKVQFIQSITSEQSFVLNQILEEELDHLKAQVRKEIEETKQNVKDWKWNPDVPVHERKYENDAHYYRMAVDDCLSIPSLKEASND